MQFFEVVEVLEYGGYYFIDYIFGYIGGGYEGCFDVEGCRVLFVVGIHAAWDRSPCVIGVL